MLFSHVLYQNGVTINDTAAANTDLWILTPHHDTNRAAVLAANPQTQRLMYTSMFQMRNPAGDQTVSDAQPADWTTATANESWFLHTSSSGGTARMNQGINFQMNVGNTGYQAQCASWIVAAYGRSGPWNGVFIDTVDPTLLFYPGCFEYSNALGNAAGWPNAWQQAVEAWMAVVLPALHAAGIPLVIGNLSLAEKYRDGQTDHVSFAIKRLLAAGRLDGMMYESFTDGGQGAQQNVTVGVMPHAIDDMAWCHAQAKTFIGHTYATDADRERAMRYALGTLLMVANPDDLTNRILLDLDPGGPYTNGTLPWFPEYASALELGDPVASYTANANGTFSRPFRSGTVTVNPTGAIAGGVGAFDAQILAAITEIDLAGMVTFRRRDGQPLAHPGRTTGFLDVPSFGWGLSSSGLAYFDTSGASQNDHALVYVDEQNRLYLQPGSLA